MFLTESKNVIATRDKLWVDLLDKETAGTRRILDEAIEFAYIDLYGYDPQMRDLFREAINRLRLTDERTGREILLETQADVMSFQGRKNDIQSAELGNCLRERIAQLRDRSRLARNEILLPFQRELARLIDAGDSEIFKKRIRLQDPGQVFPTQTDFDLNPRPMSCPVEPS